MNTDEMNPYGYDEDDLEWFDRFEMRPVDPDELRVRLEGDDVVETLDLPTYLDEPLLTDVETGSALYRLVQLFGTPNVPGLEAGADQPPREQTTWQYLFELEYDSPDGDRRTFHLSVYDYKTDVSAGLSTFADRPEADRHAVEPSVDPPAGLVVPEGDFLVGLVTLVSNVVDEPVPATYRDLWV